jgi:hypothetical protein
MIYGSKFMKAATLGWTRDCMLSPLDTWVNLDIATRAVQEHERLVGPAGPLGGQRGGAGAAGGGARAWTCSTASSVRRMMAKQTIRRGAAEDWSPSGLNRLKQLENHGTKEVSDQFFKRPILNCGEDHQSPGGRGDEGVQGLTWR